MPGEQGVSLKEAIGAAKRAARKDDKLAKQFKNLNKWHQTEKDERRKVRSIHTILRPLEDAVEVDVDRYTDRVWDSFEFAHRDTISELDSAKTALRRAVHNRRAAEVRIAKKYGFA